MDVTAKPFDNVDVRTALKWAIDREEIAKKVFLVHAVPGNDNPIARRSSSPRTRSRNITSIPRRRNSTSEAGCPRSRRPLGLRRRLQRRGRRRRALPGERKKAGIDINIVPRAE